jgi:AraC family transcriptional regulator of adaptative response/methylated-DNA-[protein]-cysteine methyltransferase
MSYAVTRSECEQSLMQDLCRYIETNSQQPLTLNQLAKQVHLSPHHLQRRFKEVIGVSPKEYLESCRLRHFKRSLKKQNSVTEAIYDAGFGSVSRVYERVENRLGMTPKQYRTHGGQMEISYAVAKTPLGRVILGATDRGLCFLAFGDTKAQLARDLKNEFPNARIALMKKDQSGQFDTWIKALSAYLSGKKKTFDLPLDIRGTAFQIKVWKYLQTIPPGHTQSYTEVARGIGKPRAVRAVASACANNNVSLVIPCHRVLRGDGNLAGYRWGLERKRALIALEQNP